ncbi:cation diffusion facilitator family transporter [Pseudomonas typographi]|uniref:cation diffusion facilitator family transporter n=1 Tax=Pseudomonas typographi TaxID=2715964 RepID=UPI001686C6F8|nr:cation diffusion facilitator family transporter [Pseudomonas typographi]MBD1551589.1 cation transporter [Pseudomonas typographi]MBD1589826.1 cation transporter [Pseudomonas typographi]
MSAGHNHAQVRAGHEKKLLVALLLTTAFMIAEIVGGLVTGSLALLSDAAHMFTDAAALAISLIAFQIAKKPADRMRTFGYARFEILASAFNAILLFFVALYILYEAYQRLVAPSPIQSTGMLIIAVLGLLVNLISMRILASASDDSLNMKGAYLEVWSDMLGSMGVIIAAILIRFTGWTWVDSLVAAAIGLWVLPRTWTLLRESMNVLLEGVPNGIDLEQIEKAILAVDGVKAVHDLHVWSVTSAKNVMSVHVVIATSAANGQEILGMVTEFVSHNFEIGHCTIQLEHDGFHDGEHSEEGHHH